MTSSPNSRFRIIHKLGQGGMGVVYEADDRKRHMRVALKTLHQLEPRQLLRFKREFRALSNFSHRNVINLYELVSEDDGWCFTMELIEGHHILDDVSNATPRAVTAPITQQSNQSSPSRDDITIPDTETISFPANVIPDSESNSLPSQAHLSLSALIADDHAEHADDAAGVAAQNTNDPDERPHVDQFVNRKRLGSNLIQLVDGLIALHSAGLIHCDLKPSNIMVTREGRVVVMDFGLVNTLRRASELGNLAGGAGTPAYMAPEQIRGEPVTAAADWYSFGVLLYRLLTQQMPYEGHVAAIMYAKQERDPKPPSTFTRGIPAPLEQLCMQLLSRQPDARPSTDEIRATLARVLPIPRQTESPAARSENDAEIFVGRAQELAAIKHGLRLAQDGQMHWISLEGRSGLGKSALLTRFGKHLGTLDSAQRPRILRGRCQMRENLAYKAFDGIIDQLCTQLDDASIARLDELSPGRLALLARLFPVLAHLPGGDAPVAIGPSAELRAQAIAALRELLTVLTAARPLIIQIEDLHWADSDSFELLTGLLHPPALGALLIIVTVRSESLTSHADTPLHHFIAKLRNHRDHQRIALAPLSETEQAEMVRLLFAHETTNPIAHGLRYQTDTGIEPDTVLDTGISGHRVLHEVVPNNASDDDSDDDGEFDDDEFDDDDVQTDVSIESSVDLAAPLWRASAGHPLLLAELVRYANTNQDTDVPTLEDLLVRRVRQLDDSTQALLEAVAVMGEAAPIELLAEAAALPPADRERALTAAIAARLARTEALSRDGDGPRLVDVFHDKVREALLQAIPPARIRRLHRLLAQALESRGIAPAELLAHHWLGAGMNHEAIDYLVESAKSAESKLAFDHAERLYENVAELIQLTGSGANLDKAKLAASVGLARAMRFRDHNNDALALLERSVPLAKKLDNHAELAEIYYLRGSLMFSHGNLDGCMAAHEHARRFASRIDSPRLEASVISGLADAHYLRGRVRIAREHYDQCINICRTHGLPDLEAANLSMRGLMDFHENQFERALADAEEAMLLARRIGYRRAELNSIVTSQVRIYAEHGRLDIIFRQLAYARNVARDMGARRFEAMTLLHEARVLAEHERTQEAERLIRDCLTILRAIGTMLSTPVALGILARVTPDPEERHACLSEAEGILASGTAIFNHLYFRRDAIDGALVRGELNTALNHANALERYTAAEPLPWSDFFIARGRALVAHALDPKDLKTHSTLQRLADLGRSVGFTVALRAIEQALADI